MRTVEIEVDFFGPQVDADDPQVAERVEFALVAHAVAVAVGPYADIGKMRVVGGDLAIAIGVVGLERIERVGVATLAERWREDLVAALDPARMVEIGDEHAVMRPGPRNPIDLPVVVEIERCGSVEVDAIAVEIEDDGIPAGREARDWMICTREVDI